MISLSSTHQFVHALSTARDVTLTAYTLASGPVLDALDDAARRGAHVHVRLEGAIYRDDGTVSERNRDAVERLAAHGADAKVVHITSHASDPLLHLKAAVVDGVLYLDDRNWSGDGDETIIRDDFADDIRMVHDAADGTSDPHNAFFAVRKREALASEARLIDEAKRGDEVLVESESFGGGNRVYSALDAAARRGARVHVLVSSRDAQGNTLEAEAIARLEGDGASVRMCASDEKFAVVGGTRGWIGSANATAAFAHPDQLDWGMRTDDKSIITHLRQAFMRRWKSEVEER